MFLTSQGTSLGTPNIWPSGLGNNTVYVRGSQFKLSCGHWNLRSVISHEHNTIDVKNLAQIESISTYVHYYCLKVANFSTPNSPTTPILQICNKPSWAW